MEAAELAQRISKAAPPPPVTGKAVSMEGNITVERYNCPPEWQFLVPGPQDYEPQAHEVKALATAYKNHLPLYLVGPAGSGKNKSIEWFANLVNRPMFLLSMAEGTGIDQFIGSVQPVHSEKGNFSVEFRLGALPLAIQAGGIFVADEMNAADERALMRMHDFLASGERLTIYEDPGNDGKFISPIGSDGKHNGFMVVATGNPEDTGQYSGTKAMNEATLDRFLVVETDYLGMTRPDAEAQVVANASGIKVGKARRLVDVFNILRTRSKMSDAELQAQSLSPLWVVASTRRIIMIAKLSKDLPIMRAIEIGFTNKVNRQDRPTVHKLFLDAFAADGPTTDGE